MYLMINGVRNIFSQLEWLQKSSVQLFLFFLLLFPFIFSENRITLEKQKLNQKKSDSKRSANFASTLIPRTMNVGLREQLQLHHK